MIDREILIIAPLDASPEVPAAGLDEQCGDDEDLRARVEA